MEDKEKELETVEETEETEAVEEDSSNKDVKIEDSTVEVEEDETEEVEEEEAEEKPVPYKRFKDINDKYEAVKAELDGIKDNLNHSQAEPKPGVEVVEVNETNEEIEKTHLTNDSKETVSDNEELQQYKEAFNQIFEIKLNSVPEQFRDLVPEGSDLSKLQWIESALNKGLFEVKQVQDFGNSGGNPLEQEQQDNTSFIKKLGRKF